MASGSFTGTGSYVHLKISWSSTINSGKTGSTVNATLYAVNTDNSYWYATVNQGYSITINGSKKEGSTATLSTTSNGTATLISHSVTVTYTGDKSITISGAADLSNISHYSAGALGKRTVSKTVALDKNGEKPPVPTVSSPTKSTVSETTTSITVKWAKSSDYSGKATYTVQVSKNGGTYSTAKSSIANGTLSYSYTITPKQGDTYQFRVKAVNDIGSSSYSTSGIVTINSLSAPTIGTLSTYNPYVTATLSVPLSGGSQANGSGFKRMAALYYGSTKLATCTTPSNGNTTASITYSAANFIDNLGTTKYSDTFTIKAWSENSNGSKSSVVSKNFTVNINTDGGASPTLATPTLSGGYAGYTSTCFVVGKHNLKVTSGSASVNRAPEGTTLSYKISCTGATDVGGTSTTFTGLTAGKKTITVTVTDSRGLSTSKTVYCRYQEWAKPTVTISKAERNEDTPSTIDVVYSIKYTNIYAYSTNADTAGTQLNSITEQMYTTSSTYTACTSPFSITGTNTELNYNVIIRVKDKFYTSESDYSHRIQSVGSAKVYISTRYHGVGLNCIPETGYRLQVGGKLKVNESLYVASTISCNGLFRNHNEWLGIYPTHADAISNTNRKGYIGFGSSDTDILTVSNNLNGDVTLATNGKALRFTPDGELLVAGKSLIDLTYPVGSIYMSVNSTNPSTLFGGTWVQLKDRFLLGSGDTYTNGATGGSATHTLTVNEMPSHSHDLAFESAKLKSGADYSRVGSSTNSSGLVKATGGGQAHNNMPPYLVVYMWKRTA